MRYFLIVAVCLIPSSLDAQEAGDTIIVISDDVELKSASKAVDSLVRGVYLRVEKVSDERLWVFWRGTEGWISRSDVIPFEEGIEYFTNELRQNPTARNYVLRGIAWRHKGDADKAISDLNEAIRLDPDYASAYNMRGTAWSQKGDLDKAFKDFNEAIRLNPSDAKVYSNRGIAWCQKGNLDKGISDFNEAIRLDSKEAAPYNNLAWLYATAAKDEYRNGEKAVEYGQKGCELTNWKRDSYIETLAVAYAEKGEFDDAIKWLKKAVELGPENNVEARKKMLELFESGKPYRD